MFIGDFSGIHIPVLCKVITTWLKVPEFTDSSVYTSWEKNSHVIVLSVWDRIGCLLGKEMEEICFAFRLCKSSPFLSKYDGVLSPSLLSPPFNPRWGSSRDPHQHPWGSNLTVAVPSTIFVLSSWYWVRLSALWNWGKGRAWNITGDQAEAFLLWVAWSPSSSPRGSCSMKWVYENSSIPMAFHHPRNSQLILDQVGNKVGKIPSGNSCWQGPCPELVAGSSSS